MIIKKTLTQTWDSWDRNSSGYFWVCCWFHRIKKNLHILRRLFINRRRRRVLALLLAAVSNPWTARTEQLNHVCLSWSSPCFSHDHLAWTRGLWLWRGALKRSVLIGRGPADVFGQAGIVLESKHRRMWTQRGNEAGEILITTVKLNAAALTLDLLKTLFK